MKGSAKTAVIVLRVPPYLGFDIGQLYEEDFELGDISEKARSVAEKFSEYACEFIFYKRKATGTLDMGKWCDALLHPKRRKALMEELGFVKVGKYRMDLLDAETGEEIPRNKGWGKKK